MAGKKITEFTDGGSFQAGDGILVARGSDNFKIDGGVIANTVTKVANLTSRVSSLESSGGGGGGSATPLAAPLAADFSDTTSIAANGPLTMVDDASVGLIITTTPQTGDRSSIALKAVPASGDWTVTARMEMTNAMINYGMMGFGLYNGTGTCAFFGPEISRVYTSMVRYSISGGYVDTPFAIAMPAPTKWHRIVFTASNSTYAFQISENGQTFVTIGYRTASDLGGAVTKIGLGFGVNQNPIVPGYKFSMTVPYWNQSF